MNDPNPDIIAKYICYLHSVLQLAPKTIAIHKSVVTTFASPQNSDKLSSHPLVKQTLKAVFLTRPPRNKQVTWDVEELISYLKSYTIKEDSLFQVARHTAILLLLATGRRNHDLTLLDIQPESMEIANEYIILWPKFGSKTDSATFRQSGWKLIASNNDRLNIPLWVKQLIDISKSRRPSDTPLSALFITTRGHVKPASRTVIAGWIRTLFRDANIVASPGSCRAAVNSDNWSNNNLNIDEVIKKGNWRSKDTFIKYYFKEIPIKRNNQIENRVSQSFEPV